MKTVAVLAIVSLALLSLSTRLSAQQLGGGETDLPAPPKPEEVKAQIDAAVKQGNLVFTATVDKVQVVAQTHSIPPSILMQVTLKDPAMLKGDKPSVLFFRYSAVQGRGFTPAENGKVLVVANPPVAPPAAGEPKPGEVRPPHRVATVLSLAVKLLLEATDDNVAIAKKAIENAATPPDKTQPKP